MAERCDTNGPVPTSLTTEELSQIFPNLLTVTTAGELNDLRHKRGVWVFDRGFERRVLVVKCPNFVDGACQLATVCFSEVRKRDLEG